MRSLILSLVLILATGAYSEQFVTEEAKAAFDGILKNQTVSKKYFKAPFGLIGLAMTTQKGKKMVAYSDEKGEFVVAGMLIDTKTRENLAVKHAEMYAPEPDYRTLLSSVKDATFIQAGNKDSSREMYVFVDPRCGYCHKTYQELAKLSLEKDVSIKYIPVSIFPNSMNEAQGILGEKNEKMRYEALRKKMLKLAYSPDPESISRGATAVKENTTIMKKHGFSGVPVVISVIDDKVSVSPGMPNFNALRASL